MLIRDMVQLRTELERGEEVRPEEVGQLLARVKSEASELGHDDLKLLKQEVDTIEGLVREATEQIASDLQSVQSTREGHYGYAHLRSHKTGQRLYRKA